MKSLKKLLKQVKEYKWLSVAAILVLVATGVMSWEEAKELIIGIIGAL